MSFIQHNSWSFLLLFPIVLCKFATELSLSRAAKSIYDEPLLVILTLTGLVNLKYGLQFIQLLQSTRVAAADILRHVEMLVEPDAGCHCVGRPERVHKLC